MDWKKTLLVIISLLLFICPVVAPGDPGVSGSTIAFYEETLYMHEYNVTQGVLYNPTNLSASDYEKGDNLTLQFCALGGSCTNTSTLTIENSAPTCTGVTITRDATLEQLKGSETCTDNDNDTITTYREWYKNGASLNITSENLTGGNYTTGDNLTYQVTPGDGTVNGTSVNSSVYLVGDLTDPTINNFTIPANGVENTALNLDVNCTDNSAVSGVTISFKDPNGVGVGPLSMTGMGGGLYRKSYTPSVVGDYTGFNATCTDGNSNSVTNTTNQTLSVSAAESGGGGGGGGGSVLESCEIIVNPEILVVRPGRIAQVDIINNEESSYRPSFSFSGDLAAELTITNSIVVIEAGAEASTGVQYLGNETGTGTLTISSDTCREITLPLTIEERGSTFFDLLFGLEPGELIETFLAEMNGELLSETRKAGAAPVAKNWMLLLITLLLSYALLWSPIAAAARKQEFFKVGLWVIFGVFLAVAAYLIVHLLLTKVVGVS